MHQVSPKGRGPGRRSEHSAAAVDGTMFIIGGRSTTAEFKDMYALDTEVEPPVWTEVSVFSSLSEAFDLNLPRLLLEVRSNWMLCCTSLL